MSSQTAPKFTKRAHKKSRNGCTTCKLRRVKCDETHPTCMNCTRRGSDCVYVSVKKDSSIPKSHSSSETLSSANSYIQNNQFATPYQFHQQQQQQQQHPQVAPALSFSPGSTSSSSASSDLFNFNQYNYNFQNPFDPTFLNTNSSLDSPVSSTSFDDKANLFANISLPNSVMTPANIFDPEISEKGVTLLSNNAQLVFPSYMDHTKINNKLLEYYTTVLIYRLTPLPEMAKAWCATTTVSFKFSHLFHMIVTTLALILYYEACEEGKEPYLNFKDPEDYLLIDQLNYQQFLEESKTSVLQPKKSTQEIFSHLAAGVLHLLRFVLSPTATVCDPAFYKITSDLCTIFQDVMPIIDKCGFVEQGHNMDYYSPFSTPRVVPESHSFFPGYLYQLCHSQLRRNDTFYDYSGIHELMETELERGFDSQIDDTEKENEIDEMLRLAINILKREYVLVYNQTSPEVDSIRVLSRWPSLVPVRFVILLNEHEQRCLIVVAHYLMLLGSLDFDTLFPKKSLADELSKIDTVVEDVWKPWLDNPKRALGLL